MDRYRAHPAYRSSRISLDLGAQVRSLREQQGWSQAELARRIGITKSAVARLETGQTSPTLPELDLIARVLRARLSIELTQI
ncbi:MAG TPA: helix-turn-helix transcriptional regulator [Pseudonocardiaceae bacterium]|nr:helix-turn-helix transcriptional regulator [Pseudonocardiaceae bacterium]